MRFAALIVTFLCVVSMSYSQVEHKVRAIPGGDTCIAVYTEDWGLFSRGPHIRPLVVVWDDGKILWSKDNIKGGAPYLTAEVASEKVAALTAKLKKESVFDDKSLKRAYFGPDSQFTSILIKTRDRAMKMSSWHEIEEAGGRVATSNGVELLNGRTIEDVIMSEPAEYQKYRRVWSSLRRRIAELIPAHGTPDTGEVTMLHGVMSWVETSNAQKKSK